MPGIDIIQAGTVTDLDDATTYYWMDEGGFGLAPLERVRERGPLQHGDTDVGFELMARRLRLGLFVDAGSYDDLITRRNALIGIFTPTTTPLQLRLRLDDGRRRQIDCHYSGGLDFDSKDREGFGVKSVIELYCPDPTWYDPTAITATYSLGGGGSGFAVPTAVPTSIGASTADVLAAITYAGTWLSYPTVRIIGPVTDAIVTNQSTGEKLDFTGVTIGAGDWYEIDTRYGYKTVRDAGGVNRIANLTSDSNLATFHLAVHPEVSGGANSIRIQGSGITSASQVVITYYTRYAGV